MRCFFVIALIFVPTSLVYAASPTVESVSPAVGQRGTDFTLKLVGAGLDQAKELLLYSSGVTCLELNPVSGNELTVKLRASSDCPLGSHPFRVRTPHGISELRIFRVTPFTVVAAAEPNETPQQAMSISNNVTVTGSLEKGDVDCFQLTLRRGERLSAEVEAVRLGANLIDTVLTVFGPDGKTLTGVDDTPLFRQDPFLTLVAPVDGIYVVSIQEVNLEGDENSRYALHLGTFPRPSFVFPAGGCGGKQVAVCFHGDAAGRLDRLVSLPAANSPDFGLFAEDQGISSPTPVPFRVSPFENVLEAEPNGDPTTFSASTVELPIAFNGVLEKNGDIDCYRFRMRAGQIAQFEAFADRIGSPVDTMISILDGEGRVLVANDDYGSHDSQLVFQAPRTDDYILTVVDQRGAGGVNFVYRVEATEPQPGLLAFLPRPDRLTQERQAIAVPQGNRVLTFLAVQRQRIESEIRLSPRGLPTGIINFPATIPADRFHVPVVIEASADAPLGGGLVQVFASGEANGSTVIGEFRQVVDLVNASADRLYQAVTVDRLAMAVVEPVPIRIRLEEPKAPLVQDGSLELTVHVDRATDFTEAIDVTFPFLPPWVDGPAKLTIPADKSSGVFLAHAFPQAEPRTWQVCAEGRTAAPTARESIPVDVPPSRRRRRNRSKNDIPVASQLVDLKIAKSPVKGTIGTNTAEQGASVEIVCSIERLGLMPDQLEASLEGLPNRVEATPVTIGALDTHVRFPISLDVNAPVGEFRDLVCRLSGMVVDQSVTYRVGRGGILKIEAPGGLKTDREGRPLSRLEALRLKQQQSLQEKSEAN